MENPEETTLMNTKIQDLTVKDQLKYTGAVLAITVGAGIAWNMGLAAKYRLDYWREERRREKATETITIK